LLEQHKIKAMEEVFFKHYHNVEVLKRNEAISLFRKRDYSALNSRFNSYLSKQCKDYILKSEKLEEVISELNTIKSSLPNNAIHPFVQVNNSGLDEDIVVEWIEYNIVGEERCVAIARDKAVDSVYQMKNKPLGTLGLSASSLYGNLTAKS